MKKNLYTSQKLTDEVENYKIAAVSRFFKFENRSFIPEVQIHLKNVNNVGDDFCRNISLNIC